MLLGLIAEHQRRGAAVLAVTAARKRQEPGTRGSRAGRLKKGNRQESSSD